MGPDPAGLTVASRGVIVKLGGLDAGRKDSIDSAYSQSDDESATLEEAEVISVQKGAREVQPKAISPAPTRTVRTSTQYAHPRMDVVEDYGPIKSDMFLRENGHVDVDSQMISLKVEKKESEDMFAFDSPTTQPISGALIISNGSPDAVKSGAVTDMSLDDLLLTADEVEAELR